MKRLKGRGGFSLVELLTVVALIFVLTGIALYSTDPRPQAYLAVMQADLRNLVPVMEAYKDDNGTYPVNQNQIDFTTSPNVQLVIVGDSLSWSARTQHKNRTDYRCAIYYGPANPIMIPAEEEGVIGCLPKKLTGTIKGKKKV